MPQLTYHLFVYGSLRSGFKSPAYAYISRYFHLIGPAKVKGRLYDMGDYPAAIPSTDEHYIVGELYVLNHESEFNWAIEQLDDYEGVHVEEGEAPLYIRKTEEVITDSGNTLAWMYWLNGSITNQPLIESGDVLAYIKSKL